jgi:hypothetical protein
MKKDGWVRLGTGNGRGTVGERDGDGDGNGSGWYADKIGIFTVLKIKYVLFQ